MVEVRIRHYSESKAVHLTEVAFDKIDTVIPSLYAWGVAFDGNVYEQAIGQFVIEHDRAYFEVIVDPEEA